MSDREYQKLPDAQLSSFVIARAKLITKPGGWRSNEVKGGKLQRQVLAALAETPMSVRDVLGSVTFTSITKTVDVLAGLLARDFIELADGKWRAKAAKADAA